jgi:tyrosyl-tRNA synthetase
MSAVRAGIRNIALRRYTPSRHLYFSAVRWSSSGNVLDTLASRSLLSQVTAPNSLRKHLQNPDQRTVYVGVDPSADSLHVGNLLPLVAALHFINHGHRLVVLIGGATGSIGDPSGRDSERSALSPSQLADNVSAITRQVHDFFVKASDYLRHRSADQTSPLCLDNTAQLQRTPMQEAAETSNFRDAEAVSESAMNESMAAQGSHTLTSTSGTKLEAIGSRNVFVINNEAFYKNMNILTFLRDVGKMARVGTMLARDSVKSRLQPVDASSSSSPTGLSFTEFSYQLLQAYDFSVLHKSPYNCTIQLGGSDQMGNIMAGVDLIRRQKLLPQEQDSEDTPAYGLTLPLLTTASGAKFGKSAGNAVWLSSDKCSDLDLYQFFYRSRDDEVELYLKTLTMLSLDDIKSIMRDHSENSSARRAQKVLAAEVTELIRGKDAVAKAQAATRLLFETKVQGLQIEEVLVAFENDPRLKRYDRTSCIGVDLTKIAVDVGLASSKGEARRAILNGGFYLNNVAVQDAKRTLQGSDMLCDGRIVILRIGRTEHRIIALQ